MCIKAHVLYTVAAVVVVDKAVVVTIECHPCVAKVLCCCPFIIIRHSGIIVFHDRNHSRHRKLKSGPLL